MKTMSTIAWRLLFHDRRPTATEETVSAIAESTPNKGVALELTSLAKLPLPSSL